MLDMTDKEIRPLRPEDRHDIIGLLSTRTKLGQSSERDNPISVANYICKNVLSPETHIIFGLYDAEELDAIVMMEIITEITGYPCVQFLYTATRRKQGRVKTAAGWDLNHTLILNRAYEEMEDRGLMSAWVARPGSHESYTTNPDLAIWGEGRATFEIIETIKAGEMASGEHAEFIKANIMTKPRPTEDWIISHMVITTPRSKINAG